MSSELARSAMMVRSRSRESIRKRLTKIRQLKDKKKSTGSYIIPPSSEKDHELCDQIEDEARDSNSIKVLKQNKTAHQASNPNVDEREGIDDVQGCSCVLSPIFMQEGQDEEAPPPHRSIAEPNISSQQEKAKLSSVATFHVRISIGQMTGLKIDELLKRTKPSSNNRIVVGFVELLSSGKYTALSQPLLLNLEEIETTRTILWATQHNGEEASKSKSRRCLHFSLSLERENGDCDSFEDIDDGSVYSYTPEIVKLLVGLKCGDERLPLGVAKFVVNGREAVEQNMDLIVLPVTDIAAGWKKKRGIFGKKNRTSFTNGNLSFTITPSAKLRIKADVKIAYPGQNGAEIWGDEECSYASATKNSFDPAAVIASGSVSSPRRSLSFTTIKVPSLKRKGRKSILNKSLSRHSQKNEKNCTSVHTDFYVSNINNEEDVKEVPMRFVSVDKSSGVSVSSDISTRSSYPQLWTCQPLLCGGCVTGFSSSQSYQGLYDEIESVEMMENEMDSFGDGSEVDSFDEELRSLNLSEESSMESSSCQQSSREY